MTTKEERQNFANMIKIQLETNNWGFQVLKDKYTNIEGTQTFFPEEAKNMRAIRELNVRLNLWIETGKLDEGKIEFPEARRIIVYKLDDKNIKNCKVNLLKQKFIK